MTLLKAPDFRSHWKYLNKLNLQSTSDKLLIYKYVKGILKNRFILLTRWSNNLKINIKQITGNNI